MEKNRKFISFFGSIGVGKTTTGKRIEKIMSNTIFIPERVEENIFIDKFYNNPQKWGFLSSLEMLILMVNQFDNIPKTKDIVILDNGIAELICYTMLEYKIKILSADEFYTYKRLYNKFIQLTPKIDLYVYFYCNIDTQLERIAKRNREYEATITKEFLKKLNLEYINWINTLPKEKVILVDTEKDIDIDILKSNIIESLETASNFV